MNALTIYEVALKEPKTWWNRFFTVMQFVCVPLLVWWIPYKNLPPPGWAVAFLALAAAAMSIHEEMKNWQKVFWIGIMAAMLTKELRAIDRERDRAYWDGVTESHRREAEEAKQTGRFEASMTKFESLLGQDKQILRGAKEVLDSVTGGNNVAVLAVSPELPRQSGEPQGDTGRAFVYSPSGGIVRNVTVRVVNIALFDQDIKAGNPSAHDETFSIGDMPVSAAQQLSRSISLGPGSFVRFNIFFSGLNGFWNENLLLRKKNGEWHAATRVFRKYTKLRNQSTHDIVFQKIDPNYLDPNEKMNWDAVP